MPHDKPAAPLLLFTLVIALALSGCGGAETPRANEPAARPAPEARPAAPPATSQVEPKERGNRSEKPPACAEQYNALIASLDDFDLPSAERLMEIAQCFESAGQPGLQIRIFSEIRRLHPTSEEARLAIQGTGEVFEKLGMLPPARRAYEDYLRLYGRKHPVAGLGEHVVCLAYALGDPKADSIAATLTRSGARAPGPPPTAKALCPDAMELLETAICRNLSHERERTDEAAEMYAEHRARHFEVDYVAPADLCAVP